MVKDKVKCLLKYILTKSRKNTNKMTIEEFQQEYKNRKHSNLQKQILKMKHQRNNSQCNGKKYFMQLQSIICLERQEKVVFREMKLFPN